MQRRLPDCCLEVSLSLAYVVMTSFNWWYMFLLPAMVSIVACSCGEKDRKLGEKAVCTPGVTEERTACKDFLLQYAVIFRMHDTVYSDIYDRSDFSVKICGYGHTFPCIVCGRAAISDVCMADPALPFTGTKMRDGGCNRDQYGGKCDSECECCNGNSVADSVCDPGAPDVSGLKNFAKWSPGRT